MAIPVKSDFSAVNITVTRTTDATSTEVVHGGDTRLINDGWVRDSRTWTYVNSLAFSFSTTLGQSHLTTGMRIRVHQPTLGYKSFLVASIQILDSTTIQVNLWSNGLYTLANEAFNERLYSMQYIPTSFPLSLCVRESELVLSDVTTGNVSTTAHGFVPKATNDKTTFLRADGSWATFPAGSGFPSSPASGQRYFRTDLGWACYHDGSRWLTEFELVYNVLTQAFSTSPGQIFPGPVRTDYAPYFTRFDMRAYVETTNNATNYWRIRLQGSNTSWSAQTDIDDRNTSTYSANTHYHISVVPSGTRNPTNKDWLRVLLEKTGSPGTIWTETAVCFRLIVT